ncbi:hypothetical protein [Sodalis sp. RH19]|uniref:hypothetical protein n=1 Tax=Sodalis sp. RH19 TaxID=3394334 RepID=UPI0039B3CC92
MHAVEHLEQVLNRVQFIADLALIAKCQQSELKLALTLISEIADSYSQKNKCCEKTMSSYFDTN